MEDNTLHILLADDDADDRMFFKDAMEEIKIRTEVSFVNDGLQLMNYLNQPDIRLPHVVFLDLNMPIKSGNGKVVKPPLVRMVSTEDGRMGICTFAPMQLFVPLCRRAGPPLPPC